MQIAVVSRGNVAGSPEARALIASLRGAGNTVSIVQGIAGGTVTEGVAVVDVEQPMNRGFAGRVGRKVLSVDAQQAMADRALRKALASTAAEVVYPLRRTDADIDAGAAAVVLDPRWSAAAPSDISRLAPTDLRWSTSPAGPGLDTHRAPPQGPPRSPQPGRHAGTTIALAARFTTTNPSRYLRSALERAGVEVIALDGAVDWTKVPASCRGVVVVESPLPALEVVGTPGNAPLVMWVHHGENHVAANVRLAQRYGADAVMLAHSWHLAHRFPVPVHRLPFGVAPELADASRPFAGRSYDVAMVASGLAERLPAYSDRYEMAAALSAALGERAAFRSGLSPEAMAALYADARLVLNDGGDRHHPITMRVFEAMGNGAALLTADVPGLATLFAPGTHYLPMQSDIVAQVESLATDERTADVAAAGERMAHGHHTYDHRVDELVAILGATTVGARPAVGAADGLAAAVDRDVDVHTVAALNVDLDLPDRAVYAGDAAAARLAAATVDAVVVGAETPIAELEEALRKARRYVYAPAGVAAAITELLRSVRPEVAATEADGVVRFDLGAPGYRIPPGGGNR